MRPFFCTVGVLPVLPGEDVPGHDEPGPRPRHLGHLRAGEGLQGIQSHEIGDIWTTFYGSSFQMSSLYDRCGE